MNAVTTTPARAAQPSTFDAIAAEVARARAKFPDNRRLLAALVEEVGELAQALLDGRPWVEVEAEAVQVATVAIRLAEEGDPDFEPHPPRLAAGAEAAMRRSVRHRPAADWTLLGGQSRRAGGRTVHRWRRVQRRGRGARQR